MEPLTSLTVGYVTGKGFDLILDKFGDSFRVNVIDRWSKYRARNFFESFCQAIHEDQINGFDPAKVELMLDEILKDEAKSEILFDAYRMVCLARSKEIGPRIIACLTAKIIKENRIATDDEEIIFYAAESLNDSELAAFANFVEKYQISIKEDKPIDRATITNHGDMMIRFSDYQECSNTSDWRPNGMGTDIGPLDMTVSIGIWANKLKNIGILNEEIREKRWIEREDSERHIDEDVEVRELVWIINIRKPFLEFANLIDRFTPINLTK